MRFAVTADFDAACVITADALSREVYHVVLIRLAFCSQTVTTR
jgi:hypothetical protein